MAIWIPNRLIVIVTGVVRLPIAPHWRTCVQLRGSRPACRRLRNLSYTISIYWCMTGKGIAVRVLNALLYPGLIVSIARGIAIRILVCVALVLPVLLPNCTPVHFPESPRHQPRLE